MGTPSQKKYTYRGVAHILAQSLGGCRAERKEGAAPPATESPSQIEQLGKEAKICNLLFVGTFLWFPRHRFVGTPFCEGLTFV